MHTLRFKIPNKPKLVFTEVVSPTEEVKTTLDWDKLREMTVRTNSSKHSTHAGFRIYRSTLQFLAVSDDLDVPKPRRVVCKLARERFDIESLEQEAAYYVHKLDNLQGFCVPWFYGAYKTTTNPPRMILLVEEFGKPLETWDIQRDLRERLGATLLTIHDAGINHNALESYNIMTETNSERVVVVNFEEAEEHTCKRQPIQMYTSAPDLGPDECREVWDACWRKISIYTSHILCFYGVSVTVGFNTTPDEIAQHGDRRIPYETRLKDATDELDDWKARFNDHRPYHDKNAEIKLLQPLQLSAAQRSLLR